MRDKIYLPSDVPDTFHYAVFGDGFITLYEEPSGLNETLDYYRIYYNYSSGFFTTGQETFGNYEIQFQDVPVSYEFFDRPDAFKIVVILFAISVFGLWLFNLMTSSVKHKGLLSGLF